MPPGSSAIAKAGRPNRSFSRAATSPTTPGCQPCPAATTTAPFSSMPSAASASASASASVCCSITCRSRLSRSSSAAIAAASRGIRFEQQAHAEIGAPDAAARIDARPEQEAEMPAFGRAGEARRIHQRGQADMLAPAHREQALGDEGAVEPFQRHHVGDGAERHQVEEVEQVRLRTQHVPEAALAQFAIDRDHGHEHEAEAARWFSPDRSSCRFGLTSASTGGSASSA